MSYSIGAIRGLFPPVVYFNALLACLLCPTSTEAQWQVQAAYAYADGHAAHGGTVHVQHGLWNDQYLRLYLRGEGEYRRGSDQRGNWNSIDQSLLAVIAPILEASIHRFQFRGGVAVGGQYYHVILKCPDRINCLSITETEQETRIAVGGLAEVAYGANGGVYPFMSFRRMWAPSNDEWPVIRSATNSVQVGLGLNF